ncbi:MAG: hypothetical protein ACRD2A_24475 [Vicinamibacterales bacterium]
MKSPLRSSLRKRLEKKAKKGFRGYPIGSLAFYGPDDRMATKMVAAIVQGERDEDIVEMRKWFASDHDVRNDETFAQEVWTFFATHGVRSIVMPDRIIGCPHEEGIDYEGPVCPQCPFWANRDRWTGEIIH